MKPSIIFNSIITFFTANHSSSMSDTYSNTSIAQSLNEDPPRPRMMSCESDEQCPKGSMCIALVGKYGICVVTDTS